MPTSVEPIDEAILVVTFAGNCSVQDINLEFINAIFPYCNERPASTIQIIYDITLLEWTFSEFVEYLESTRKDNEQGIVPANMQQYFVGSSQLTENIRQWLNANYSRSAVTFSDLSIALDYVKRQT